MGNRRALQKLCFEIEECWAYVRRWFYRRYLCPRLGHDVVWRPFFRAWISGFQDNIDVGQCKRCGVTFAVRNGTTNIRGIGQWTLTG